VKKSNQITSNVGLYYVCFELSRRGWNVMPTARNARGIDIVAYDMSGERFVGIQVRALSKNDDVPLGTSLENLMGDYWVVVSNVTQSPMPFIMLPDEVKSHAVCNQKNGKLSFWLPRRQYENDEYLNAWERIGQGVSVS
jgi:hypothetical protein